MRNQKATFQDYNMNQLILPMDYSDLIPNHHVARVVNDMVNALDDQLFIQAYEGGGRPAYHPKMMTKIVLYGYSQKWFSCRAIAQALRENLPMMWLAAGQTPDFRTINRFRAERLKPLMDTLFSEMVKLLVQEGYVDMNSYFLDGTKIEANANKYSFVWKKSTLTFEEKLQIKIEEALQTIDHSIAMDIQELKSEDATFGRKRICHDVLEKVVLKIEQELKAREEAMEEAESPEQKKIEKAKTKPFRQLHRMLKNNYLPRLAKYEAQMGLFGERNSYSKTDPDATFMRMKDDHMNNGQLKAGYNWQVGTQNQFILGYSVHQNPTDTRCLKPHVDHLKTRNLPLPQWLVADAGYGSEPNYLFMHEQEIKSLIPYGTHRQEQKTSFKKKDYHPSNWHYEEKDDFYWCPNQRKVVFKRYSKRTDQYGHVRDFKIYECESCDHCPFRSECTKAKGNRQVHYNPIYEELKAKEKAKLHSHEGRTLYAKRKIEVESVFGHVKQNLGFRRLYLRGIKKVTIELGLIALAHNIRKRVAVDRHLATLHNLKNKSEMKISLIFHLAFSFYRAFGTAPLYT